MPRSDKPRPADARRRLVAAVAATRQEIAEARGAGDGERVAFLQKRIRLLAAAFNKRFGQFRPAERRTRRKVERVWEPGDDGGLL